MIDSLTILCQINIKKACILPVNNLADIITTMSSKKRPAGGFEPVGDILRNTLAEWVRGAGEPITQVWELWDQTVGEAVARNAQPSRLKNRILVVHVTSSAWTHQLQYSKKEIIAGLNHAAGKILITDIKFRIGELES